MTTLPPVQITTSYANKQPKITKVIIVDYLEAKNKLNVVADFSGDYVWTFEDVNEVDFGQIELFQEESYFARSSQKIEFSLKETAETMEIYRYLDFRPDSGNGFKLSNLMVFIYEDGTETFKGLVDYEEVTHPNGKINISAYDEMFILAAIGDCRVAYFADDKFNYSSEPLTDGDFYPWKENGASRVLSNETGLYCWQFVFVGDLSARFKTGVTIKVYKGNLIVYGDKPNWLNGTWYRLKILKSTFNESENNTYIQINTQELIDSGKSYFICDDFNILETGTYYKLSNFTNSLNSFVNDQVLNYSSEFVKSNYTPISKISVPGGNYANDHFDGFNIDLYSDYFTIMRILVIVNYYEIDGVFYCVSNPLVGVYWPSDSGQISYYPGAMVKTALIDNVYPGSEYNPPGFLETAPIYQGVYNESALVAIYEASKNWFPGYIAGQSYTGVINWDDPDEWVSFGVPDSTYLPSGLLSSGFSYETKYKFNVLKHQFEGHIDGFEFSADIDIRHSAGDIFFDYIRVKDGYFSISELMQLFLYLNNLTLKTKQLQPHDLEIVNKWKDNFSVDDAVIIEANQINVTDRTKLVIDDIDLDLTTIFRGNQSQLYALQNIIKENYSTLTRKVRNGLAADLNNNTLEVGDLISYLTYYYQINSLKKKSENRNMIEIVAYEIIPAGD